MEPRRGRSRCQRAGVIGGDAASRGRSSSRTRPAWNRSSVPPSGNAARLVGVERSAAIVASPSRDGLRSCRSILVRNVGQCTPRGFGPTGDPGPSRRTGRRAGTEMTPRVISSHQSCAPTGTSVAIPTMERGTRGICDQGSTTHGEVPRSSVLDGRWGPGTPPRGWLGPSSRYRKGVFQRRRKA